MPFFNLSVPVAASPAGVWALVSNVRRVATLFSFTSIDEVTEPEPACWRFRRRLAIPTLAELCWWECARVTAAGELAFHVEEGDLQTFQGRWLVAPEGTGARLTLELEYAIPPGLGPKVPEALANYAMHELFATICRRVKQAAEEDV